MLLVVLIVTLAFALCKKPRFYKRERKSEFSVDQFGFLVEGSEARTSSSIVSDWFIYSLSTLIGSPVPSSSADVFICNNFTTSGFRSWGKHSSARRAKSVGGGEFLAKIHLHARMGRNT